MRTNATTHDRLNGPLVAEFDPAEHVSLILPGQGKLEGMTFTSNEHRVANRVRQCHAREE